MKPAIFLLPLAAFLALPGPILALEGRVLTRDGKPIEHARVEVEDTGAGGWTGADGSFDLPDLHPPCRLLILHDRFEPLLVEIGAGAAGAQEFRLEPRREAYEEVVVTASGSTDRVAPVVLTGTAVRLSDAVASSSNVLESLETVPGVAENGQGGIFQTYSVRGSGRHRVMTLVDGMRVTTERRAGVSASFLDPALLGSAEVLRGPASTHYGSGALGGVVQLFPREFESWGGEAGWESDGDAAVEALGWGGSGWNAAFAHRKAENPEAPDGTEINSHFERWAGVLGKEWKGDGGRTQEVIALPSLTEDIGKGANDYPARVTEYPREGHLFLSWRMRSEKGWTAQAFAHPNDLVTETWRTGRPKTRVENEAVDLGGSWQREFRDGRYHLGADWFGRRGVDSEETAPGAPTLHALDGAEEDEFGVHGSARWTAGRATVEAGARVAVQRQDNSGWSQSVEPGLSGYAGLVVPFRKGFEIAASAGTGLRFPSLSERFYSGTTGRGGVLGNPDLDAERSLNVEAGLRWFGRKTFFGTQVFHNRTSDYIERVETAPDLFTYVNLDSGTIRGVESELLVAPAKRWEISLSGHWLRGRSDDDEPLADVPSSRLQTACRYQGPRTGGEIRYEYRFRKDDPGEGEVATGSARVLSGSFHVRLVKGLALAVTGSNLLDETYPTSADEKAPLAAGWSWGLGLRWRAERGPQASGAATRP